MSFLKAKKNCCHMILLIAIVMALCACSDKTEEGGNYAISVFKVYTVIDGVAEYSGEIVYNYLMYRWKSDTDYEYKLDNETIYMHVYRKGENYTSITQIPSGTQTTTIKYHLETGAELHRSQTSYQGVTTEISYTILLQDNSGGVKTYKHYITSTGGTGAYTIYRNKDKKNIEVINYNASGVISSTRYTYSGTTIRTDNYNADGILVSSSTSSRPDNSTIRKKLPNFRLTSSENYTNSTSSYQQAELLSNSSSEIEVRLKYYSGSGVLAGQSDIRYKKVKN